ncbi:MAG: hypothetical protein ACP5TE_06805 [Verrucomicrobiia bacterium]
MKDRYSANGDDANGGLSNPIVKTADNRFNERDVQLCRLEQEFGFALKKPLPPETSLIDLLGVKYAYLKTEDGGDLYLSKHGVKFWEHLLPENWYAKEWFETKSERLIGTSIVYKVPTREVDGRVLQLVVKWSRVGEQVPLDTLTINKFINAEFNSPFEEFALVTELRESKSGPAGIRINVQRPLGIFVPSQRFQLWQTGRSEAKIAAKIAQHPGIELDILRQYVLLFEWIKGYDAVETAERLGLKGVERDEFLARVTMLAIHELEQKGYRVIDMKPEHVILRLRRDGTLLRDRNNQIVYAVVDYELLARTPEHEQAVRSANRKYYLQHMAKRFEIQDKKPMPVHLKAMNILGVDYIYGRAESTGGLLWVVGRDPDLFNYFLPERWRRTPKRDLSLKNRVFYTQTKDNIKLVWRISRMGERPARITDQKMLRRAIAYGYNSPFEEFAYALKLSRSGFRTIYPRAIYRTGSLRKNIELVQDLSRFELFNKMRTPDGFPLLEVNHEYITIWGFWNGPDEYLAEKDGLFYRGLNARQAMQSGLINEDQVNDLIEHAKGRLIRCGYEDLNLKPDHLLITFTPDDKLLIDTFGKPEVRLCNFELVKPLGIEKPIDPMQERLF